MTSKVGASQVLMGWAKRWTSFSFTEADERQMERMILAIEAELRASLADKARALGPFRATPIGGPSEWVNRAAVLRLIEGSDPASPEPPTLLDLPTALGVHAAVRRAFDNGEGERVIGARFVGLMLGVDLMTRYPKAALLLRESMALMQDESPAIPGGRHDMDEDVDAIASAVEAGR